VLRSIFKMVAFINGAFWAGFGFYRVNNKIIRVEHLYEGYFHALYPVGYAYLKQRDETEEIIQHLFLRIVNGKIDLESIDKPAIFLKRAVRNAAVHKLKKMNASTFKDSDVILAEEAKILYQKDIHIPDIEDAITRFKQHQELAYSQKKKVIFILLGLLILAAILATLLM